MKKLTVLVLVLALVFSVGSISMAKGGRPGHGGPGHDNGGCHPGDDPVVIINEEEFCVIVDNPLYGEIEGLPDTSEGCVDLGSFEAGAYSEIGRVFPFAIKSNGFLKVSLGLDPFTHTTAGWEDQLATNVLLTQGTTKRAQAYYEWQINNLPNSYVMADTPLGHPSGRGVRQYDLNVRGKLADIHEQAHGQYRAVVTVTLSDPK